MNNTFLHSGNDLVDPYCYRPDFGEICAFSIKSGNKDGPNEDSLAIIQINAEEGILVVADGLGGHACGDRASRIAIEAIAAATESYDSHTQELRDVILAGIDKANKDILALGSGSATTIVVIEVTRGTVRSYHVGDSVALVTGQRGKIKAQTISHSPVGYALESGLISEHDAMLADDRNVVSNIVGCTDMRIEMGPQCPLAARDTVLVASDGLTDNLMIDEIIELSRKGPIRDAAHRLRQVCLERMQSPNGHMDDLSVILFRPTYQR